MAVIVYECARCLGIFPRDQVSEHPFGGTFGGMIYLCHNCRPVKVDPPTST